MELNLSDLVLKRGERIIAGPINLSVAAGDYLAIRGPNGIGKSTLLRTVAGLLRTGSGSVRLTGHEQDPDTPIRELMHYFGHLDGLKNALTVRENLIFFQQVLGTNESNIGITDALDRVSLGHAADLPVSYLSAGMRKRAALARLLLSRRPVWLLDEPTSALDTASVEQLGGIMNDHLSHGGIILAATHLPLPGAKQTVFTMEPPRQNTHHDEDVFL